MELSRYIIVIIVSIIFILLSSIFLTLYYTDDEGSRNPILMSLGFALSGAGGSILTGFLISIFMPQTIMNEILSFKSKI